MSVTAGHLHWTYQALCICGPLQWRQSRQLLLRQRSQQHLCPRWKVPRLTPASGYATIISLVVLRHSGALCFACFTNMKHEHINTWWHICGLAIDHHVLRVCLHLIQVCTVDWPGFYTCSVLACMQSYLSVRVLICMTIGHVYHPHQPTACGCDNAQTSRSG